MASFVLTDHRQPTFSFKARDKFTTFIIRIIRQVPLTMNILWSESKILPPELQAGMLPLTLIPLFYYNNVIPSI